MSFNEFELPQTSRGIGGNPRIRMEDRRDAVLIKNASKKYGKDSTACTVLSDLNMCVKEGTIYTLLGSSGCGKTTLLSCIVGTTQLDDGECKIFGLKPGTKECGIPGKNVGFMPQEIALYGEFTIEEAMHFFGTVNGMSNDKIKNRMVFLKKFLNLPSSERQVRNLSGGQQRRVSFAVALLHQPKILILDEPTVGVDPMLRKSIWRHLTDLVESGKTTVIITTHYIEEATGAHRQDRPVDEDGIENSSEARGTVKDDAERLETADSGLSLNTIPDSERIGVAFCNERNIVKPNNINDHAGGETPKDKNFNTGTGIPKPDHCPPFPAVVPKYHENLDNVEITERTLKHEAIRLLHFLLAGGTSCAFLHCHWGQPTDLPLGVVNLEVANSAECMTSTGCSISNMSCNFLKLIDNKTLTLNYFDGERMALEAVKKGNVWGYLVIPANFSAAVLQAGVDMVKQKEDSFLGTHVKLALDMTSKFKENFAVEHNVFEMDKLNHLFHRSANRLYNSTHFPCHLSSLIRICHKTADSIIQLIYLNLCIDAYYIYTMFQIAEPIYGSINSNFREFMAPGIILSIIFFMSVALTGSAFITERKEGMLNRMLVSGVSTGEIITAHMLTQYIIMAGQTVLVLAVMIVWV
ncbi:ABC transporter G family member 23 [Orchesella cincta]|uniref:ABC transporter G family member 23 n=1 Tax=Orchesella cincta TaxID=48709 RepID=A0A1D2N125_ORCCI|nr:ABC transporter G family member 23 [Orchesella cincta]